jgi:tetratricopeptide (TPR) repeat protein
VTALYVSATILFIIIPNGALMGKIKYLFFALIFVACTGVRILTPEEVYDKAFLERVNTIKKRYSIGDFQGALADLNSMDDGTMNNAEKAMKYNLVGVIFYAQTDYKLALAQFNRAAEFSKADFSLTSEIFLNKSSTHFKLKEYQASFDSLKMVQIKGLLDRTVEKRYYDLRYKLGIQLGKPKEVVVAAINLLKTAKRIEDVDVSELRETLLENFRSLSDTHRVSILSRFEDENYKVIAYLGMREVESRYFMGDKGGAKDVLSWLRSNFGSDSEVKKYVDEFRFRIQNYSKVDIGSIGVILPLSNTKRSSFGKRALVGIDTALHYENNKKFSTKIFVKDNQDNPQIAIRNVRELIQKHHVSVIVGGLFPSTATIEYQEAKKYGVVYISLSPIYLKKEAKDHLLIEVQGSVESQVNALIENKFVETFGNRMAIIYPQADSGYAYMNEFWRKKEQGVLDIRALHSFPPKIKDFRNSVSSALGLKYKREREEELELWKKIHGLEKKSMVRRIQDLTPVLDFDWVFLPSYPFDTIQIVSTFKYYDAGKTVFVGGPSWMSRKLFNEQRNLGKLFFVGSHEDDINPKFTEFFKTYNQKRPTIVETLTFEAVNLGINLIQMDNYQEREELEKGMLNVKLLSGVTGSWKLVDGIWMKDMSLLRISRRRANKVNLIDSTNE